MIWLMLLLAGQNAPSSPGTLTPKPNEARCEVSFEIGRDRPRNLEVSCEADIDVEGAERYAYEISDWRRDYNRATAYRRGDEIETTLILRRIEEEGAWRWTAEPTILVTYQPSFPFNDIWGEQAATCVVNYNVRSGYTRVVNSSCDATLYEEEFAVRSRNVVRRWIFTAGEDADCRMAEVVFISFDSSQRLPVPSSPPCPVEEE